MDLYDPYHICSKYCLGMNDDRPESDGLPTDDYQTTLITRAVTIIE